jgi:glycosyltransferase involved in cell wall biosynthesis
VISLAIDVAQPHLRSWQALKIVQLGKYFPPHYFGGIEIMAELSARALAPHHEVTVVCHNQTNVRSEETRDGYRLIRCSTQVIAFSQPISLFMGLELMKIKPDLIHFHAPNFWGALMVQLFCPRTPIVITHHADVEGRQLLKIVVLPLYRHIARRAKSIIVNSLKNIKHSRDLPAQLTRTVAIPYGASACDLVLTQDQIAAAAKAKQEQFGDSVVVGFLGRFVWYKGIPVLLEAIAKVPNVKLLIVGDGPLNADLRKQTEELRIGNRVHFAGSVSHSDKLKCLHMMDLLVLPSTHITEAFGISQVEAQFCSRPVIASNLPTGVSDVTVHDVTGLLVPPGNADALAAAIAELAANPGRRQEMGIRGRERALANYSEEIYVDKLNREMQHVLAVE